eukprot:CAMPEP_0194750132 /NCGR_PEP_ID=MMETSP0323_2-20130528/4181_1 /TAXON_ID=2866 ORGANISM="Crypthecodinium cohnii, Strain Seligo" /NCGR_SAMPLE_ID=MMETSP0323_2 /ASSEMBLY_ACC=CAM_ASM_000346 /LENGTH=49 /DNA_ID= /DNA_START= /DNA_END= /DNA_ORIENTATION=
MDVCGVFAKVAARCAMHSQEEEEEEEEEEEQGRQPHRLPRSMHDAQTVT